MLIASKIEFDYITTNIKLYLNPTKIPWFNNLVMLQMIIQPTKYEKLSNFQGFVSSKRTEYMAAIHGYNQTKRWRKESKETNRQNVDEKNLKRQTDKT